MESPCRLCLGKILPGEKNIRICGRGILDGSFNKTTIGNDNRFISLTDCENISIEGINLHNGTTWQVALSHCNNVKINDNKIVSESGSDDGIDIFR
jgi:polygalacturonase